MILPLFFLAGVKGVLFALLIPLGQGPDEPAHVAYTLYFVRQEELSLVRQNAAPVGQDDPEVQQAIFVILNQERFWALNSDAVEIRQVPSASFQTFAEAERQGLIEYAMAIRSHISPLFFFLAALPLRWLGIETLWFQWIFLRLLCVALGLGVMGLTYVTTRTVVQDEGEVSSAAAAFVGFLPQYAFFSATVSPDHLLIFLASATLYTACRAVQAEKKTISALFLIVLSLLCVVAKRAGLASVVFAFFALPLLFRQELSRPRSWLFVGGLLVVLVALIAVGLEVVSYMGVELYGVLVGGVMKVLHKLGEAPQRLFLSFPSFLRFSLILFVSFWFSYGWMIYKMALGWYELFALVTLAGCLGVMRTILKRERVNVPAIILLTSFTVAYWLSELVLLAPELQGVGAQGRHLLPTVAAVGGLLALGIRGLAPEAYREPVLKGFVLFMVFINVVAVGKYVVPLFYLE